MEVRQLVEADRDAWADFVHRSNNGTVFHLPQFLDYHPPDRFDDHHLTVEDGGEMLAVVPGALSEVEGETWFSSYPGASYGGPVIPDRMGLRKVEKVMDAVVGYCRDRGWEGVRMTIPPQVYFRRPHNYIDFALSKQGLGYSKRELSAVIDLSRFGEEVDLAFRSSARRGVRKAIKNGIRVEENDDFGAFYPVLETNLKDRHGVRPTHTLEELFLLRKLLGGEKVRQFVAVDDRDRILAGMVMFHCNPRVTLAFYISHDEEFQKLRPVNLLYREVIDWARQMGYRYLDLGTFTLEMDVNYGLCRFKESFTARGRFRDTFSGRI
ncbi:GNAT family N-acetyltransferase [Candidatus Fermentibacteria bacterium]|nr:GNAT family N-acetyltransferase [Candidatus Fermentibacteria bacterium]